SWSAKEHSFRTWLEIGACAVAAGSFIGWTWEKALIESLTVGDWVRSWSWGAVATLGPVIGAVAIATGQRVPSFERVLGRPPDRFAMGAQFIFGALLVLLTVLAVEAALGLTFDPRYRDFPFPALTGALVPFLLATPRWSPSRPRDASAQIVAAAALALSAISIFRNETPRN